MSAPRAARLPAAAAGGAAAAFVAAVAIARSIRPALLVDPDPSWAAPRLLLGLALVAGAAAAAAIVSGAIAGAALRARCAAAAAPLPFSGTSASILCGVALACGAAARAAGLGRLPPALWVDDVSLLPTALSLPAGLAGLVPPFYAAPLGVPHPFGTVGAAYLAVWRLLLEVAGATVAGVRLPSLLAGLASLATAALLGRRLLPRGGGALAALVLAGLRWHLILSRWGWVAIAVAPIVDAATLVLLRARRRGSAALAAAAGLIAGLAAHVYLSAWIAAAALVLFAAWPASGERRRAGGRRAAAFAAGFAVAVVPLLLPRGAGAPSYFARAADHNVGLEIRRARSLLPLLSAAADAAVAPYLPDPTPRHDLPGKPRLGWILGVPVAAVAARALLFPRDELSGWLLAHATAASAAAVAAGEATLPNGFRYAYLTTVVAVAAAGGVLWLLGFVRSRRLAALAAVGLLGLAGTLSARDALAVWAESRETYDGFHGEDTLIGRAAARWDACGVVDVSGALGFDPRTHSPITIGVVRRYRLDPDPVRGAVRSEGRRFRVVPPDAPALPGERRVERVRDPWGRERAAVYGRRAS